MIPELSITSSRARKARLARGLDGGGVFGLTIATVFLILGGVYCLTLGELPRVGYLCFAFTALALVVILWHRYDLQKLPMRQPAVQLDDIMEPKLLAHFKKLPVSPIAAWQACAHLPEGRFICNRLLMDPSVVLPILSERPEDMQAVWDQALSLNAMRDNQALHAGTLAVAILLTSPAAQAGMQAMKLTRDDLLEVLSWLNRQLYYVHHPKPNFGGIGRDWASGFTPTLDRYGENISQSIEAGGGFFNYVTHQDLVPSIAATLGQGSAVALVGADGTGKSTLVDALAEYLSEGRQPQLKYYQIHSLNASVILSNSGQQLERLMLTLFGDAVAAGNIILFLDDAHLFFGSGVGAFDMSQVLAPLLGNRRIRIIATFTPNEWQRLQAQHSGLANGFTAIAVNEPDEASTMKVIEDMALVYEHRNNNLIAFTAVKEAYRLSAQYMQERAFPGKALSLLEQALPYANQQVLTPESVQTAIEKTKGVKVGAAAAPEVDMLLHLEDRIHERMINQKKAVNVVAAALRRGRAGVTNPKRPLGSFLFLGPTGVGKTELARSLAAVYFGDENQMIRLDMSEYQQPSDVSRLLDNGTQAAKSLLVSIREQPFSVVLFDEIEKAHPNILNLFLQLLDEGQLTDANGTPASFRSSIIIATSNAGAPDIAARVQQGGSLDDFERPLLDKLIASGQFKPELLNRFDETVLFRPLTEEELSQVAQVMLRGVNQTLAPQHISVELTPEALKTIVHAGYDPEFGARPMRRIIQKTVENAVAIRILEGKTAPGSVITLDVPDVTQQSVSE
jgi:ATP-dependent Clp protease ATP-binding subunit ClpC